MLYDRRQAGVEEDELKWANLPLTVILLVSVVMKLWVTALLSVLLAGWYSTGCGCRSDWHLGDVHRESDSPIEQMWV